MKTTTQHRGQQKEEINEIMLKSLYESARTEECVFSNLYLPNWAWKSIVNYSQRMGLREKREIKSAKSEGLEILRHPLRVIIHSTVTQSQWLYVRVCVDVWIANALMCNASHFIALPMPMPSLRYIRKCIILYVHRTCMHIYMNACIRAYTPANSNSGERKSRCDHSNRSMCSCSYVTVNNWKNAAAAATATTVRQQ